MEYQWGAGCTERCKSGSERGLQKPVSQRHKALLSYSTTSARPPFPRGRTAQATTAECWKCATQRIRRVWILPYCCAPARAARGHRIDYFTQAWQRRFRWPTVVQVRAVQRRRCPTLASSIPLRSPAAVRMVRFALCRSDEVKNLWAHFLRPPTAAQRLATHNMAPPHGAQAAAAARVRVRIGVPRRRNPAWA